MNKIKIRDLQLLPSHYTELEWKKQEEEEKIHILLQF
jgi:hypothetical protein